MNKAILIGRLTRDPEVRYTQSGTAVCTFTLAVDRRFARKDANDGQPTADFIPIVAWQKLAGVCGNNLVKGRRIAVEGRIQTRSYDAQDGSKRYVTEIVANEIEFLEAKNAAPHTGGYNANAQAPAAPQQSAPDAFGPQVPDEEIPF